MGRTLVLATALTQLVVPCVSLLWYPITRTAVTRHGVTACKALNALDPSGREAARAHPAARAVPDGRTFRVFESDSALSDYLVHRVEELASQAIESRGAFCLSIGSGTTAKPLARLAERKTAMDFGRWHVFFGNERTEDDTAFKCFEGAMGFVRACGIPEANAHKVPAGEGGP